MTEIEEQPNPKPTTLIPDNCIWVCLYWVEGIAWPMTMVGQDKADVIKWATQAASRVQDKPMKLYKLEY
jgi:hypothetical protein